MKKLVAALIVALTATVAWAHECPECNSETVVHYHAMFFQNNVGGLTVITDRNEHCGSVDMMDGYAFDGNQLLQRFCWVPRGAAVMVKFPGLDTGMWPFKSFEPMYDEPDISKFIEVK